LIFFSDLQGWYWDGSFTSPTGVPFEQRAVTPSTLDRPFKEYTVVKPIPVLSLGKLRHDLTS